MAIWQAENTAAYSRTPYIDVVEPGQLQPERVADGMPQSNVMYRHNVVFLDQNVLLFVDIVFQNNEIYYGW